MRQKIEVKNWQKPNFFIIGAPRCGTTSLAVYLNENPNIYLSDPKEPHFFNTDMKFRWITTLSDYKKCFPYINKEHKSVGEASVFYLYSREAMPNILCFNPEAKFIVMLRNPIEMSASLHAHMYFSAYENVSDFKTAWGLQGERSAGKNIPLSCKDPFLLQYKKICSLGKYLGLLFSILSKEQVHVIIMDDMKTDMPAVYESVLDFLDVTSDGRKEFPLVNENKVARSRLITYSLRVVNEAKRCLGITRMRTGLMQKTYEFNIKKQKRMPIGPEFMVFLAKEFHADVERLSHLIERDLMRWVP